MASTDSLQFTVLVYPEGGPEGRQAYIAHCLNYDMVAKGGNVREALNSLERIILGQILISKNDGIAPFSDFDAAPAEYWARYANNQLTEAEAFTVAADIGMGDLEFLPPQEYSTGHVTGRALMKLAA